MVEAGAGVQQEFGTGPAGMELAYAGFSVYFFGGGKVPLFFLSVWAFALYI